MASIPGFQGFYQSLRQLGHWPEVAPCHGCGYGPAEVRYGGHQDRIHIWGGSRATATTRRLITTTATRSTWLRPDGGGAGGLELVYLV
jgi:hypothetical protein